MIGKVLRVPGHMWKENREDGKVAECYFAVVTSVCTSHKGIKADDVCFWFKYPDGTEQWGVERLMKRWVDDSLVWGNLPAIKYIKSSEDSEEDDSEEEEKIEKKGGQKKTRVSSDISDCSDEEDVEVEENDEEFYEVKEWKDNIGDVFKKKSQPTNLQDAPENLTPLDIFCLFLGKVAVKKIAEYSNDYLKESESEAKESGEAFPEVHPFTTKDIYCFFGILFYMAHMRMPRIEDYFLPSRPYSDEFPDLKSFMSLERFYHIKRFIHFADAGDEDDGEDELFKIRFIVDHVNKQFQHYWQMGKWVALDEKLVAFKGHTRFRVMIKNKPKKWGIRFYMSCDSESFYCNQFVVDTSLQLSMTDLFALFSFARGQVVFTDRFYTTTDLANSLIERGVGLIGTTQTNRFPVKELVDQFPKQPSRAKPRGSYIAYSKGEEDIAYVAWMDSKPVFFTCTYGSIGEVTLQRRQRNGALIDVSAPKVAELFCDHMGGVDANDHYCADLYSIVNDQRTYKWTNKCIFAILDIIAANSWIIYQRFHANAFKHKFYRQLFKDMLKHDPYGENEDDEDERLQHVHTIRYLKKNDKGRIKCVKCRQCKERHQTSTGCKECNVGLHAKCFHDWHSGEMKIDGRQHQLKFDSEEER